MKDECLFCPWADVTMRHEDGTPIQVYCLPHIGGCPKEGLDDLEDEGGRTEKTAVKL